MHEPFDVTAARGPPVATLWASVLSNAALSAICVGAAGALGEASRNGPA